MGVETIVYADSDHAGDYVDCKTTSGVCTFMRCCLTSWFSKKQTALAISTIEAEYVSTEKGCQQALWMKPALVDYDINLDDIPVLCDNKGAIDLSKNLVLRSRTKHIEIRHHCNTPKMGRSEKYVREHYFMSSFAQDVRERPLNVTFEKKSCKVWTPMHISYVKHLIHLRKNMLKSVNIKLASS
ncbi:hypothetical protein Tco_1334118 [Tanacetum coccineum]